MCRPGLRRILFARLRGRRLLQRVRLDNRHAAEVRHASARDMSGGWSNRHTAELRHATACDMSCRPDRNATELPRSHVSGWSNRHTAELRHAAACDMSGWTDGHATELPSCARRDMSRGSNRHATELHDRAAGCAVCAVANGNTG